MSERVTITEFLLARIDEDEAQAGICRELGWVPAAKYGITAVGPARTLAECAAKQAVVAEHDSREIASLDKETWGQPFQVCRTCAIGPRQIVAPCPTLKHLAAVYKDHPDYQEEWAE